MTTFFFVSIVVLITVGDQRSVIGAMDLRKRRGTRDVWLYQGWYPVATKLSEEQPPQGDSPRILQPSRLLPGGPSQRTTNNLWNPERFSVYKQSPKALHTAQLHDSKTNLIIMCNMPFDSLWNFSNMLNLQISLSLAGRYIVSAKILWSNDHFENIDFRN